MFKKTNIKTYLLTVFMTIIIFTAIITAFGAYGLLNTKEKVSNFVEQVLEADSAFKIALIEINASARDLRELVFADDEAQKATLISQIEESSKAITANSAVFTSLYEGNSSQVQRYESFLQDWFSIANRAKDQLAKGNVEAAEKIIREECSPALSNLQALATEIGMEIGKIKTNEIEAINNVIAFEIVTSLIVFAVAFVISLYIAFKTTADITTATNKIKDAVHELSQGNLKTTVDYEANNEFGELAKDINFSFKELDKYIGAIGYGMSEFSKGNFDIESPIKFLGDFHAIQEAIDSFRETINKTLVELDDASTQVGIGAG
ncbi:MAG: MCP four helix bundle domain-containing protein, partial [Anaerotignaceae bacterium]